MSFPNLKWESILTRGSVERQITLTEQQQYIFLLLASMLQQNVTSFIPDYSTYDIADINQTIDESINALLNEGIPPVTDWKYGRFLLFAGAYDDNVGTVSYQNTAGYWGGVLQTQGVVNCSIGWDLVPFKKGTYKARYYGDTGTNFGIATLYVPFGTSVATFDTYAAVGETNKRFTSGTFTIADDGYHYVLLKTVSKNPSSSAYVLRVRAIEFIRTGD